MNCQIPKTQTALQLTGPNQLTLNTTKPVSPPGPEQILCQIEAVGLCFSDLKLLKQFSSHVRKSKIVSGIAQDALSEIPSYVPGDAPTVPGHEAVVRVCEIGTNVRDIKIGERFLVQPDYRWLLTEGSNAAFGYNFEGALQEYVLFDQRAITSPDGESMLIAASEHLSASAVALVEPWGCVEQAYSAKNRTSLKTGGQTLIVADGEINEKQLTDFFNCFGKPAKITIISKSSSLSGLDIVIDRADNIDKLTDTGYDDIIYFGSNSQTVQILFDKVATGGLLNIVLCGSRFATEVSIHIGRVHYGNVRIIGTVTSDPADSMRYIPKSGEIRRADKINVIGAAGPMGVMHVVRNICHGIEGIEVFAGDLDRDRLAKLTGIVAPLAEKNNVGFKPYNPNKDNPKDLFDYIVLMAPIPKLVNDSVKTAAEGAIINIFAGIPATVIGQIDFNTYIERHLYLIGTSGLRPDDIKTVLQKIETGRLDTNISVAAVCGLSAAAEAISAVENHLITGKIIVLPACKDLPLLTLDKLPGYLPQLAEHLKNGLWNKKAEDILLEPYK